MIVRHHNQPSRWQEAQFITQWISWCCTQSTDLSAVRDRNTHQLQSSAVHNGLGNIILILHPFASELFITWSSAAIWQCVCVRVRVCLHPHTSCSLCENLHDICWKYKVTRKEKAPLTCFFLHPWKQWFEKQTTLRQFCAHDHMQLCSSDCCVARRLWFDLWALSSPTNPGVHQKARSCEW